MEEHFSHVVNDIATAHPASSPFGGSGVKMYSIFSKRDSTV
jgi:hypothetical protein